MAERPTIGLDRALDLAMNTEGWLSPVEACALYLLAKGRKGGRVVEIGSWKGRSTIMLAAGCSDREEQPHDIMRKVWAIDTFQGSAEHQANGPVWTFDEFKNNIKKAGLDDWVNPLVGFSADHAKVYNKVAIGLLFIDGAHDYASVRNDLYLWWPYLMVGGTVALHDCNWSGPGRVMQEELIAQPQRCKDFEVYGSMFVGIKEGQW